jgi:hypothetical protein
LKLPEEGNEGVLVPQAIPERKTLLRATLTVVKDDRVDDWVFGAEVYEG